MQTPLLSQENRIHVGEINFFNVRNNSLANIKASQPTQDAGHTDRRKLREITDDVVMMQRKNAEKKEM